MDCAHWHRHPGRSGCHWSVDACQVWLSIRLLCLGGRLVHMELLRSDAREESACPRVANQEPTLPIATEAWECSNHSVWGWTRYGTCVAALSAQLGWSTAARHSLRSGESRKPALKRDASTGPASAPPTAVRQCSQLSRTVPAPGRPATALVLPDPPVGCAPPFRNLQTPATDGQTLPGRRAGPCPRSHRCSPRGQVAPVSSRGAGGGPAAAWPLGRKSRIGVPRCTDPAVGPS